MNYRKGLTPIVCLILSGCASPKNKNKESQLETPPPRMLAPSVKKIWIPPVIKEGGQEWEEGHYLYRIERGTSWSR